MSSPKVKLPSIAELTSSRSPAQRPEHLPLLSYGTAPSTGNPTYHIGRRSSLLAASCTSLSPAPSYQDHMYLQHRPMTHKNITNQSYNYMHPSHASMVPDASRALIQQALTPTDYEREAYGTAQRLNQNYSMPEVVSRPTNACHRCGTTETPEWRRGPNGLRTLCNACGLYHAKLVKRKGAALAADEVLNNKVYKGKNGRRISIKKQSKGTVAPTMASRMVPEMAQAFVPELAQFPHRELHKAMAPQHLMADEIYAPRLQFPQYTQQRPISHAHLQHTVFLPELDHYTGTRVMSMGQMPYSGP